ncbi:MAG TPA: peptidoglycan-binding protein [Candidatus Limnocylindrales bacterium]
MKRILLILTVVAALGAATFAATGLPGLPGTKPEQEQEQAASTSDLPPGTAQITRQTLRETRDVDGSLGYGPASTAVNRLPGTITWLPASGAAIGRGQTLYKVDNKPVVLLHGNLPAFRQLSVGTKGEDVGQLEANLHALGYRGFTVDEEFTDSTAVAVERWQEALGLDETGVVELGRVVFTEAGIRVDAPQAEAGQPAAPGQKVLTYTGTAKVVTVELDPADQRLAKPDVKVGVALPDGKAVEGTITKVSTVIKPSDERNASSLETKLEVLVSIPDGFDGVAAVDVSFTASERKDVLTVPVAALTALGEGGFGVQVIEGSTARYLPVKTGLFAGGRVEISGEGIAPGMTVGMPR